MTMFGNQISPDRHFDEGLVLQVDPASSLCKVKTQRGQMLPRVQWLSPNGGSSRGGDRSTPNVGDKVMLSYSLGYPVIIGSLPRPQIADRASPLVIHSGESMPNVGNYGHSDAVRGDASKPSDLHLGDRVLSSSGGALLAVLRGGSVLTRASRGAEILMSKVVNVVRVVSRNWEHFTDVCSDVVRNYKGKVYRYVGYAKTFLEAKNEDYKLHFYFGNVKTAEQIKTNYHSDAAVPADDNIIYKEQITGGAPPGALMHRTLNTLGDQETWIKLGTEFIRVTYHGDYIKLAWKDVNFIHIEEDFIHLVHEGGADLIMDDAGIRGTMGDSLVDIQETSITCTNGAGESFVSDSTTRIKNGSHHVTVTSSGVAIV